MDLNFILYNKSQSVILLLHTLLHIFYYDRSLLQLRFQNGSLHKPNRREKNANYLCIQQHIQNVTDYVFLPFKIFQKALYVTENTTKAIFWFY